MRSVSGGLARSSCTRSRLGPCLECAGGGSQFFEGGQRASCLHISPRGSGSSYIAAYSASSSLLPEASERSRESDAERARCVIGRVGEQPDRLRFDADQFRGCVALRLVVDQERGCVPSELVPVGGWSAIVGGWSAIVRCRCPRRWLRRARRSRFVRSPPPVPPIAGAQGWRARSRSGGPSRARSASRSGIPFLRSCHPSLRGGLRGSGRSGRCAKRTSGAFRMRSISASSCSRMPASWFVMGGSRPAWGGFGMVASRRVSVFRRAVGGGDDPGRRRRRRPVQRSCSSEVVRVLRMCSHVVRISTIPIVSAPDECPAGCPLRMRLVVRVPRAFRCCSSCVVEVWSLDAVRAVCGAGGIVGGRRSSSSPSRPAWSRSWSLGGLGPVL